MYSNKKNSMAIARLITIGFLIISNCSLVLADSLSPSDVRNMIDVKKSNAAAFDSNFKGKTFQGDAEFDSVSDGGFIGYVVFLTVKPGYMVSCTFGKEKPLSKISSMKNGDAVQVKGTVQNWDGGVLNLGKCSISKKS
jgi:hypothetical protein